MAANRYAFRNWPFAIKFGIAPVCAIVALISVALLGSTALNNVASDQRETVATLSGAVELSYLRAGVVELNADVYKTLTTVAAGRQVDVLAEFDAFIARTHELRGRFAAFAEDASPAQHEVLTHISEQLELYAGGLEVVGSMLEMDFATAVSFVEPFNSVFAELSADIVGLGDSAVEQGNSGARAADEAASRTQLVFAGVTVLAALALAAVSFGFGRAVSRSVRGIADATQQLARRDYSVNVAALSRADELGAIVESLEVFRDSGEEAERLQAERRTASEVEAERARRIEQLAAEFDAAAERALESVTTSASLLQETAGVLVSASETTKARAHDVSGAGTLASEAVSTVASAAEELTASVSEIGGQVTRSADVAEQARVRMERAGTEMRQLTEAADQIDAVVKLISDIAEQTNLLALNATIEAARAGEAGKGFAVVATEVKTLANQTGQATGQISQQIAQIQAATGAVGEAVRDMRAVIDEMSAVASAISAAVSQQRQAAGEIANSAQNAASETRRVAANIESVTQSADETLGQAGAVSTTSDRLREEADGLASRVRDFLSAVRTA